jgi:hypothetical protein
VVAAASDMIGVRCRMHVIKSLDLCACTKNNMNGTRNA